MEEERVKAAEERKLERDDMERRLKEIMQFAAFPNAGHKAAPTQPHPVSQMATPGAQALGGTIGFGARALIPGDAVRAGYMPMRPPPPTSTSRQSPVAPKPNDGELQGGEGGGAPGQETAFADTGELMGAPPLALAVPPGGANPRYQPSKPDIKWPPWVGELEG